MTKNLKLSLIATLITGMVSIASASTSTPTPTTQTPCEELASKEFSSVHVPGQSVPGALYLKTIPGYDELHWYAALTINTSKTYQTLATGQIVYDIKWHTHYGYYVAGGGYPIHGSFTNYAGTGKLTCDNATLHKPTIALSLNETSYTPKASSGSGTFPATTFNGSYQSFNQVKSIILNLTGNWYSSNESVGKIVKNGRTLILAEKTKKPSTPTN